MTGQFHSVTVNGIEYRVELLERTGERVVFFMNGKRYEVLSRVEPAAAARALSSPVTAPRIFSAGRSSQQSPVLGNGAIVAPMPGTVLNIFVQEGEAVAAGTPLLVLEAMKMENTVVAPRDGTVRRIFVAAKNEVNSGQTLLELS